MGDVNVVQEWEEGGESEVMRMLYKGGRRDERARW